MKKLKSGVKWRFFGILFIGSLVVGNIFVYFFPDGFIRIGLGLLFIAGMFFGFKFQGMTNKLIKYLQRT